jgi:translocation and assembly module TamA
LPVGSFKFTISDEIGNDPEIQELLKNRLLQAGSVLNQIEYEDFKGSLEKLASERGYFDARFIEHRIEIDLDKYEAYVVLNYDGGSRYHFGKVSLNQQVLDEKLLLRYISFTDGSAYSVDELIDLQQALNDSDFFYSVDVSTEMPEGEEKEIPVNIKLTPRKRHRYSLGIGYGTDTGIRGNASWEMPLVNRDGHRFSTEASFSELGYSFGAKYRVPVFNPRSDELVYSAGIENETTDSSESTLHTIGASLNRRRGDWRQTISLNYRQEDFVIANESGSSELVLPAISWKRTWGNDLINTFEGLRFDVTLRGATKMFLSDADFFQLQTGIKIINPVNKNNRFISRLRLGSTWTQDFEKLPSTVRFFTGGAQSVRGFSYQSLGPVDSNDEVLGGKHLLVASIEFEHSFNEKWGAAVFYDTGNASENFSDKLEQGAGFGVRWQSPIGPVRVDIATALSRDGNPLRLHINIGPDL